MHTRYCALLLVDLVISGCITPTPTSVATELSAITPSPTLSETPTSVHTLTSKPPPTFVIVPTPTALVPPIDKLCPSNREVSLSEMEIDPTLRLVVLPKGQSGEKGFWSIDGATTTPKIIPNTTPQTGWDYVLADISPDGEYLLLRISPQETLALSALRVAPIDGTEQQEIVTFTHEGDRYSGSLMIESADKSHTWPITDVKNVLHVDWEAANRIVLHSQFAGAPSASPLFPVFTLDPATGQGRLMVDTDEGVASWDLGEKHVGNFSIDNKLYELYFNTVYDGFQRRGFEFVLYDRLANESHVGFKWLQNKDWPNLDWVFVLHDIAFWQTDVGKMAIVVRQPYGFDLATNLDIAIITSAEEYDLVMQSVRFPKTGWENITSNWHSRDGSLFNVELLADQQSRWFYVFDIRNMKLKDFCLDIGGSEFFKIHESPDERFVAWNIEFQHGTEGFPGTKEVVILELATGRIARIPDVRLLGWGQAAP